MIIMILIMIIIIIMIINDNNNQILILKTLISNIDITILIANIDIKTRRDATRRESFRLKNPLQEIFPELSDIQAVS